MLDSVCVVCEDEFVVHAKAVSLFNNESAPRRVQVPDSIDDDSFGKGSDVFAVLVSDDGAGFINAVYNVLTGGLVFVVKRDLKGCAEERGVSDSDESLAVVLKFAHKHFFIVGSGARECAWLADIDGNVAKSVLAYCLGKNVRQVKRIILETVPGGCSVSFFFVRGKDREVDVFRDSV